MRNKKWKLELLNMLKSCIQEKVQDLKEPFNLVFCKDRHIYG